VLAEGFSIMPATAPTLGDRQTLATFRLFKELGCFREDWNGNNRFKVDSDDEDTYVPEFKINDDVVCLDVEKMMARALDALAAVCEAQRVRVALKKPWKLQKDGDALTSEQQAARNRVFLAALNMVAKGLTHDGAPERADSGFSADHLLRAFPDSRKLTDGRGWLPLHWAVVAGEDKESGVAEADAMCVHATDPMELRKHHLDEITDDEADSGEGHYGYTPAHMLCGLKMTEKNMSMVRYLSESDPRAFTMEAVAYFTAEHSCSALHVACMSPHRTEALLRLLVQLDPSQMKAITWFGGPLGLLCQYADTLDERQFRCLVEADSSVEVVHDGICRYIEKKSTFNDTLMRTVAKLLEVNLAAALHKGDGGRNLAHVACFNSNKMAADDCIEILKLVLTHHKDAMKEKDEDGKLPAHRAAQYGPVDVLDFVLGEYPEAAAVVDSQVRNLLHIVAGWEHSGSEDYRTVKARMLCAHYPDMMLQRNDDGYTPLHHSCRGNNVAAVRLLCEAGGREAVSAAVQHPTDPRHYLNGWLPLHSFVTFYAAILTKEPLSAAADVFRLLLRLYPEAAGIKGGIGVGKMTAYQVALQYDLPAYYLRLLLRAAPDLNPAELCRLNWAARRQAMFVTFVAVAKSRSLLSRLRATNKELLKHVMSFL